MCKSFNNCGVDVKGRDKKKKQKIIYKIEASILKNTTL